MLLFSHEMIYLRNNPVPQKHCLNKQKLLSFVAHWVQVFFSLIFEQEKKIYNEGV
jgi:hypothetical protein